MMDIILILCMLFQIAIVFAIAPVMYKRRVKAYKDELVKLGDIAVDSSAWPSYARQAQNAFANQFELPVLFYVLCLMVLHLEMANYIFAGLAVIFVLSRWVHMVIHIGTNYIPHRMKAYAVGFFTLVGMWTYLAVLILASNL